MSLVSITGVEVIDQVIDDFRKPFGFKIQLNCMEHLESSIEFNLIYNRNSKSMVKIWNNSAKVAHFQAKMPNCDSKSVSFSKFFMTHKLPTYFIFLCLSRR